MAEGIQSESNIHCVESPPNRYYKEDCTLNSYEQAHNSDIKPIVNENERYCDDV